MMFETATNIIYFIDFESEELVASYIDYSLKFERRLKGLIEKRVAARGGVRLPIEERMLASIQGLADASGVDLASNPINKRDWGDKNLYEKAEAIGWGDAYLGTFGGMSIAVHGSWGDVATHHLERFYGSGFYRPNFEWSTPRPQHPLTLSQIILSVAGALIQYYAGEEVRFHFDQKLMDTSSRVDRVIQLHEAFLLRTGSR